MPATARPVAARYRADTMSPPASGQPTPGLVPASTRNSHRRPHLPVPVPVIALSRVVPVQARLTGRVPIPISAAMSASSCSMPTPDSSWPAAPPTLDAAHARPPAGLVGLP